MIKPEKVYEKLIPIARPSIGDEELQEIRKVFETGWLGMGKWVFDFEKKLKDFIGVKHVVAVNTGTTALHIAMDAIGMKKGDEVIVPSFTFVATIQPILSLGAKPVFCDIEPDTLNMDVEDAAKKVTRKTKAIVPVHYGGLPCDMDKVFELAHTHNLRVIEDAAHAFGSTYKGKKIGSFSDLACLSFDPIKNITCGEGGAVVTNDDAIASLLTKKRILGIDKDTWSRYSQARDWFYNVTVPGYRYHMSNINAAIGLIQLAKFRSFDKRKKAIVKQYDNAFRKIAGIELLYRDHTSTAPFNYVMKVKRRRDELIKFLKTCNVDSGVHYIPNHLQLLFKSSKRRLPVTEAIWQEIITLPLYPDMTDNEVEHVVNSVKSFFDR